jgi:acyl-CoA synthetase (AMP-forming)/AMP-acid ligase II
MILRVVFGCCFARAEYCARHLEPYEVPNRIIFRESLPVTVMGKVDRRRVLEELEGFLGGGSVGS